MVRHVVMFKMKEDLPTREDNKQELIHQLKGLPSVIEEIKFFEVGENTTPSERAFDIVLISDFENFDMLNNYRVHPAHQQVVEYIQEVCEKTHVVDYVN